MLLFSCQRKEGRNWIIVRHKLCFFSVLFTSDISMFCCQVPNTLHTYRCPHIQLIKKMSSVAIEKSARVTKYASYAIQIRCLDVVSYELNIVRWQLIRNYRHIKNTMLIRSLRYVNGYRIWYFYITAQMQCTVYDHHFQTENARI